MQTGIAPSQAGDGNAAVLPTLFISSYLIYLLRDRFKMNTHCSVHYLGHFCHKDGLTHLRLSSTRERHFRIDLKEEQRRKNEHLAKQECRLHSWCLSNSTSQCLSRLLFTQNNLHFINEQKHIPNYH